MITLFILRRGLKEEDYTYFVGSNKWAVDIQEAKTYKKKGTACGVRSLKENKKTGPIWVIELATKEVRVL